MRKALCDTNPAIKTTHDVGEAVRPNDQPPLPRQTAHEIHFARQGSRDNAMWNPHVVKETRVQNK